MSTDFTTLLRVLAAGGVDFIIVGGLAATIHGAARATCDVDVLYSRTPDNLARIVASLAPLQPYLRGAPPGLPSFWSVETLVKGLNFTLTTTGADLDLLGEITYGGTYEPRGRAELDRPVETRAAAKMNDVGRLKGGPYAQVHDTRSGTRCSRFIVSSRAERAGEHAQV